MQNEIGSNFELNPAVVQCEYNFNLDIELFGLKGSDSVFLSTGRGAENFILDTISERNPDIRKIALIPSYTCYTVIEPFLKHGYGVVSYPIDDSLNVDLYKFRKSLIASKAQVVLIHRYFGFDTLKGFGEIIDEYSLKGVVFIEDKTQCLYSNFDSFSVDYTFASLRKWAGLPDGGLAVCKAGVFKNKPKVHDSILESFKLEASFAKYEYLNHNIGEKCYFRDLFRKAEQQLNSATSYFKISPASVAIQRNLDIPILKKRRRDNYRYLYEGLCNFDALQILTPKLTETDVPLYCALSLKERNRMQNHLRLEDVYAPIIWPKAEICPEICSEVQNIYDTVLCLPVDQRYDRNDMNRILKCIKEYM